MDSATAKPLCLTTAKSVVDRIVRKKEGIWGDIRLTLVESHSSLLDDVKEGIAEYGEDTEVKGIIHKGTVQSHKPLSIPLYTSFR